MSNSAASETDFKVLIIGAGVTGLMIAQGLKQTNIAFEIFDKEVSPRTRSWGMGCGWANAYLTKLLPDAVLQRLSTTYIDPTFILDKLPEMNGMGCGSIRVFDGQSGETQQVFGTPDTKKFARDRLRALLMEGIDVKFDKDLKSIEYHKSGEGVTVFFADGSSVNGSIVVGADGAKSSIRRILFGASAEPTVLPFVLNNFIVSYAADMAVRLRSECGAWTNIGRFDETWFLMTTNDIPNPHDPTTWKFQILVTWPGSLSAEENSNEGRLKLLQERMLNWCEFAKLAVDSVKEGTTIHRDRYAAWETLIWDDHDGRVVLVGDAAHAMPFHRGQGFQNCVRDCYELVEVLKQIRTDNSALKQVIPAFVAELVDRGSAETRESVEAAYQAHDLERKSGKQLNMVPIRPINVRDAAPDRPTKNQSSMIPG